jgi:hypothetical protein
MIRPDMSSRHRVTVHNNVVATLAAGMLAVGAAVASSATAAADPPPPPPAPADPAPPPQPTGFLPAPGTPLQNFLPEGGLAPNSGYDFLLGQSPVPALPANQNQQPLILDPAAIQSLRSTNFALAGQGQQSFYSYTPTAQDAPPPGLIDNIKGAHGLWHYPMGKLDPGQLGEPLPGTAPPPGTNVPVGLGEGLPDPGPPAPQRDPVASPGSPPPPPIVPPPVPPPWGG